MVLVDELDFSLLRVSPEPHFPSIRVSNSCIMSRSICRHVLRAAIQSHCLLSSLTTPSVFHHPSISACSAIQARCAAGISLASRRLSTSTDSDSQLLLPSLALLPLSNQAASVSTPSSQFNADQLLTQEIPSILQTPNLEAQSPRMHGVLSTLAMHGSVAQLDRLLVSLISSLNQSTNTLVLSWLNTALHLYCASVRRTSASLDAKPLLRALELISTIKPLETVTCTTYEPVLVALAQLGEVGACWAAVQRLLRNRSALTAPTLSALMNALYRRGELVASDALLDVVRRNSLPHRPEHAALAARAHLKLGIPLSSSLDESLDRSALVSAAADARAALRAGVLTKHSVDSECPDDAACRALLIQCIALDSGFEAAEQALKAMTATGQQVAVSAWSILIKCACDQGLLVDAVRLLVDLEKNLSSANSWSDQLSDALILEAVEPDELDSVSDGTTRSDVLWAYWRGHRAFLSALCRHGHLDRALTHIRRLEARGSGGSSSISLSAAISNLNPSESEIDLDNALDNLDSKTPQLPVHACLYAPLFQAMLTAGRSTEVASRLDKLIQPAASQQATFHHLTPLFYLVYAHACNTGNSAAQRSVLQQMSRHHVPISNMFVHADIAARCAQQTCNVESVLKVINDSAGLKASPSTYASLSQYLICQYSQRYVSAAADTDFDSMFKSATSILQITLDRRVAMDARIHLSIVTALLQHVQTVMLLPTEDRHAAELIRCDSAIDNLLQRIEHASTPVPVRLSAAPVYTAVCHSLINVRKQLDRAENVLRRVVSRTNPVSLATLIRPTHALLEPFLEVYVDRTTGTVLAGMSPALDSLLAFAMRFQLHRGPSPLAARIRSLSQRNLMGAALLGMLRAATAEPVAAASKSSRPRK